MDEKFLVNDSSIVNSHSRFTHETRAENILMWAKYKGWNQVANLDISSDYSLIYSIFASFLQ